MRELAGNPREKCDVSSHQKATTQTGIPYDHDWNELAALEHDLGGIAEVLATRVGQPHA